ncbi:hypothetical protein GWI33_020745 [Rhynchophorus ferrugineus]|uniref:Luc7-like protein 3 n=1 Tax=Rhynchophorus ferrugineus TaxID=354439 RepID=A0A834LZ07_RHYFE|nr:hypothetical protein GWI33_020745 [Rhynchophorus ferrugineus]
MAVLAAAQLLDELMGRHRNVAPNEEIKETNWEDAEYCSYYMVKFCPHELFVNTRADLGPCSKTHDEEARKLFQEAKKNHYKKLQYYDDFVRFCSSMINEVGRKIVKGKQRLALSGKNVVNNANPAQAEKNQEKIDILNERINELEKEAEEAGTDGNVEQAQGLMKLCDKLKEERDVLKKQSEGGQLNMTAQLAVEQEKQMEVCEVCGAFLIVGDAQQRIDDHLMGKQHMGYMRLKNAVDEISALVKEIKEGPRRNKDRGERERRREKERERSRSGQREKAREKDKEREREKRDKDYDKRRVEERDRRDRDRDRERDRDRDKERRHRSEREDRHRHHHHHHSSHRHRR